MYKILTIEDTVKVSPAKLGLSPKQAALQSLQEQREGLIDKNMGIVVVVFDVEQVGEGSIYPGEGVVHYPVTFKSLVYYPEMYEIVEGEIIDITEFGAFVRMGPLDGLVHISQVMDDFVSYDSKNSTFAGKESRRVAKEGDKVRSRIIAVSLSKADYKIGLTMRQAGLGVLEWLAEKKEDKKEAKKEEKKEEKKDEKKKEEKEEKTEKK